MNPITSTDKYVIELRNAADDLETLATELRAFRWFEGNILRNSGELRLDEIIALQRTMTDITRRVSPYRTNKDS